MRLISWFLWGWLGAASAVLAQSTLAVHDGLAGETRGRVIAVVADLDGDGRPDYALGRPYFTVTGLGFGTGRVELRSAQNGSLLRVIDGSIAGERFGEALCAANLDGDGRPELLVGAPLAFGPAGVASGRIAAIDPATGAVIWIRTGASARERYGSAIASLGDWSGDRRTELAIGAPFAADGGRLAGRIEILRHDGTAHGLTLLGAPGQRLGRVLAGARDFNRDGWPELAAGAPDASTPAGPAAGLVHVYDRFGSLIAMAAGSAAHERFGASLAALGDVQGDGFADLAVGAPGATVAGLAMAGRATLFHGPMLTPGWSVGGTEAGERMGHSVVALPDFDGDRIAEVAISSPTANQSGFDVGTVSVHAGASGALHFKSTGKSDRAQLGFALAAGGDANRDGRKDLALGAPFGDPGAQAFAGSVEWQGFNAPLPIEVLTLQTDAGPTRVLARDIDGDFDQDIVVLNRTARTIQIFWNGAESDPPALAGRGVFGLVPAARISVPGTLPVQCIETINLDADGALELLIGHEGGAISSFDAQFAGSLSFSLQASEVLIDDRPVAPPIMGFAAVAGGPTFVVLGGGPTIGSELRTLLDPLGTPSAGATLAAGQAFASIRARDLDLDGQVDLLLSDAALGQGGIVILRGPSFTVVERIALATTRVPLDLDVLALQSDGRQDDLVLAATGFEGGAAGVLSDYGAAIGFASFRQAFTTPAALGVARFPFLEGQPGIALSDGRETLTFLGGFDGTSFTLSLGWPIGRGAVDVESADLRLQVADPLCRGGELLVALQEESVVRILRRRTTARAEAIPGSGCIGAPALTRMVLPEPARIGNAAFRIELADATPSAPALLFVVPVIPGGSQVGLLPIGCGILDILSQPYLQLPDSAGGFFLTSPTGAVVLPIPLPSDTALCGAEFALQWAVFDGGPVFGAVSVSEAWRVRIGEL